MNQMDKSFGIYVHIPFCVRKCDYCDFLSAPAGAGAQLRYMEALREEIRLTAGEGTGLLRQRTVSSVSFSGYHENVTAGDGGERAGLQRPVDTIFFGGGTPSILPAEEIARTLRTIRACFSMEEDAEITVECNPGTLTEEKCLVYRSCGVNRLSIGLQSADDRLLKGIGRIHTFEEFLESFHAARRVGFTNINIDLMSGLPGQSVGDFTDTLQRVLKLRPEHISAYSLILEEGTPLYEKIMGENNPGVNASGLPSEDDEMEMYVKTREILEDHGYHRYEISNYSLPGRECRHNLRYWNLSDYLGFGIGAASFADGCRYKITDNREKYVNLLLQNRMGGKGDGASGDEILEKKERCENREELRETETRASKHSGNNVRDDEKILPGAESVINKRFGEGDKCGNTLALREEFAHETDRELMEEFLFLGLRKTEGISTDEFSGRFGRDFDSVYGSVGEKLVAQGFLEEAEGGHRLRLTDRGLDFSNEVLAEFLQ